MVRPYTGRKAFFGDLFGTESRRMVASVRTRGEAGLVVGVRHYRRGWMWVNSGWAYPPWNAVEIEIAGVWHLLFREGSESSGPSFIPLSAGSYSVKVVALVEPSAGQAARVRRTAELGDFVAVSLLEGNVEIGEHEVVLCSVHPVRTAIVPFITQGSFTIRRKRVGRVDGPRERSSRAGGGS